MNGCRLWFWTFLYTGPPLLRLLCQWLVSRVGRRGLLYVAWGGKGRFCRCTVWLVGVPSITPLWWRGLRWWAGKWTVRLLQSTARSMGRWYCFYVGALQGWLSVVSCWVRAAVGWCQDDGGMGGRLLAFWCLSSRLFSCTEWTGEAAGEWVGPDSLWSGEAHGVSEWLQTSESVCTACCPARCIEFQRGCRRVSPSGGSPLSGEAQSVPVRLQMSESVCTACCPVRRIEFQRSCRRVNPLGAAGCPEMGRGLPLLLLMLGRWTWCCAAICRAFLLVCWLRCAEYVSGSHVERQATNICGVLCRGSPMWRYRGMLWMRATVPTTDMIFI
jgi:hypothetical protein